MALRILVNVVVIVLLFVKREHSHFIFTFSSEVYALIISECDEISQLSKPRVSDFATSSDSCMHHFFCFSFFFQLSFHCAL